MSKKTSKNKKSTKILVETTAGNTILDINSDVCSDINGQLFLKNAGDIHEGELVYFEKQYIDKELKDIEEDLKKSPRYNTAYESLHIDGKPMLGVVLNRDLEGLGITELKDKIIKIQETIKKPVTDTTIKNWLSGNTTMVDNKLLLADLSKISPELKTWSDAFLIDVMIDGKLKAISYDAYKNQIPTDTMIDIHGNSIDVQYGSRYTLYDLYTNIRRGIGHYLAKPQNAGSGKKKTATPTKNKITMGHEIDIVVSQYVNYVTEDVVSAKVTKIKELTDRKAKKESRLNKYKLTKGLFIPNKEKLPEFLEKNKIEQTTLEDMLNEVKGLEYALAVYTNRLLENNIEMKFSENYQAFTMMIPSIMAKLSPTLAEQYELTNCLDIIKEKSTYDFAVNPLEKNITQIENNTIEKLIETIRISWNSVPKLYTNYIIEMHKSIRNDETEIPQNKSRIDKYLFEMHKSLIDNYNYNESNITKKDFKDRIGTKNNKERKYVPLTDQDGINALQKYGLSDLVPLIFGEAQISAKSYKSNSA